MINPLVNTVSLAIRSAGHLVRPSIQTGVKLDAKGLTRTIVVCGGLVATGALGYSLYEGGRRAVSRLRSRGRFGDAFRRRIESFHRRRPDLVQDGAPALKEPVSA